MFDSSKQSFRWQLICFAPTILALSMATFNSRAFGSKTAMIGWGMVNVLCSSWCAYDYSKTTINAILRFAKTFGIALILWVLNAGTSFFGGCVCAFVGGRG